MKAVVGGVIVVARWCRQGRRCGPAVMLLLALTLAAGCGGPAQTPGSSVTAAHPGPTLVGATSSSRASAASPANPSPAPGLSGGPIPFPTSPTSASAAPSPPRSVAAFLSPSKNIECGRLPESERGKSTMACQIFQRSFSRPSCTGRQTQQAGSSVIVYLTTTGRPRAVGCASDVAVPARPTSSAYGQQFAFPGGTRCTVSPQNVRCVNTAGHGFSLAREAFAVF